MKKGSFDYSPSTIRKSVERSLRRLHTDYLDVVYLHDVEFIATPVQPRASGDPLSALGDEANLYGLAEGQESKIWGDGDQQILDAYTELRKLQEEGIVKHIGITGKNSPCLPRFFILYSFITHRIPPSYPTTVSLAYSAHSPIQATRYLTLIFALQPPKHRVH